jgi:hypothetical protein
VTRISPRRSRAGRYTVAASPRSNVHHGVGERMRGKNQHRGGMRARSRMTGSGGTHEKQVPGRTIDYEVGEYLHRGGEIALRQHVKPHSTVDAHKGLEYIGLQVKSLLPALDELSTSIDEAQG